MYGNMLRFSLLSIKYYVTLTDFLSSRVICKKRLDFSSTNFNFRKTTGINMSNDKRLVILEKAITSYPDFPKPGINFKDLFGAMRNPGALEVSLRNKFKKRKLDLKSWRYFRLL